MPFLGGEGLWTTGKIVSDWTTKPNEHIIKIYLILFKLQQIENINLTNRITSKYSDTAYDLEIFGYFVIILVKLQ